MIRTILTAAVSLSAVVSGCSSLSATSASEADPRAGQVTVTRPDAAGMEETVRLYEARKEAARSQFVQADVDFMTGMIAHHAQALVMSRLAPTNGASPAVATLCARIINAQQDEIASMQRWLEDRGQPVPQVHIDGLRLMIHGAGEHHDHLMPGMLTQAQLDELAAARGQEFDRLFLTYMIQHHSGAVTMVRDLFATDGAGQDEASFRLATDINVDQITEIERMKLMLEQLENG